MNRSILLATMLCLAAYTASAATTPSIAVTVSGAACPTPPATQCLVAPGASLAVVVANGPGNATDWVGFDNVKTGAVSNNVYLSGNLTYPSPPKTAASIPASAPWTGGDYKATFYASNGYGVLASAPFTVQADKPAPPPTPTPGATLAPIPDEKFLGNTSGKDAVPSALALPGACRPASAKVPGFDPATGFVCDPLPPGPKGDKGDQGIQGAAGISGTISQGSPIVGTPCSANDSKFDGDPTPTTGWMQFFTCLKGTWASTAKLPLGK